MTKEYLTASELIRQLSCADPNSRVLMRDKNDNLRYVKSLDEDNAIQLSTDEFDVLSNWFDVQQMEAHYLDGSGDELDFFAIAVLS